MFSETKRCSPISRVERSWRSASARRARPRSGASRTAPVLARSLASASSRSTSPTSPGSTPASGSSTSASRARLQSLRRSIQASATGAHPGDQREQPRVMDGRHVVAEEVLGGGELTLGLREIPLRREHDAHRGGDVRAEPAPTRSDAARRPPSPARRECEPRTAALPRRPPARASRAHGSGSARARLISGCSSARSAAASASLEVAGEVERAGVRARVPGDELVQAGLRQLDGTATVGHRPARRHPRSTRRANDPGHGLDVRVRRLGSLRQRARSTSPR